MKKIIFVTSLVIFSMLLVSACDKSNEKKPYDKSLEEKSKAKESTKGENETSAVKEETINGVTILGDAPEAVEPEKKDYSKEALRCRIVLLDDAVTGNFRKLTKPSAQEFAERGKILVVKAENGSIFFVYNKDGSFGSKNLARYAANDFIGILGKTKYIYDLNFIFAEYIESSD